MVRIPHLMLHQNFDFEVSNFKYVWMSYERGDLLIYQTQSIERT